MSSSIHCRTSAGTPDRSSNKRNKTKNKTKNKKRLSYILITAVRSPQRFQVLPNEHSCTGTFLCASKLVWEMALTGVLVCKLDQALIRRLNTSHLGCEASIHCRSNKGLVQVCYATSTHVLTACLDSYCRLSRL